MLVIDRATLDALRLTPGDLREEITIEGLPDVTNLPMDTELRIGGVTLRVNGKQSRMIIEAASTRNPFVRLAVTRFNCGK